MAASDSQTFGALLRQHRRAAGLSQEALAERAGISADTIAALERGRRTRPHPDTLTLLATALQLTEQDRARLVSALAADGPTAPASGLAPASSTLPAPPTPMIGRERAEAAALHFLQRPSGPRLLTLTGPGGVGKTRLALSLAALLAGEYADGIAFIDLSAVRDPALVPEALAQALGMHQRDEQPVRDLLLARLGDQHRLLVLDNFEQVLDAAALVADLLAHCPRLTLLVTSRTALHVRGEQQFRVPPLTAPPTGRTMAPETAAGYPAVQLFVARAQAIQPDFALTAANAPAVAQICARLDGLPLAIELAAARVNVLPPAALLPRLERRLTVLRGGSRDLPARQQTLRAALDWSHDLLDANEQMLFRRLAAFAGGGAFEAVDHVCNPAHADQPGDTPLDVLDALDSLLDKSLLQHMTAPGGEQRFAMLETVREYAIERLQASGEEDAVRRAHASYYLALLAEGERAVSRTMPEEWRTRVGQEQDNLRAALGWAVEHGERELGLRLATGLVPFWWGHGALHEGRRWLEAVLAMPEPTPAALHAEALRAAGAFATAQGDFAVATHCYEEGLALLRQTGASADIAGCLSELSWVTFQQGDAPRTCALLAEALALEHDAGDTRHLAMILNRLGLLEWQYGDPVQALAHFEASLARSRQDDNRALRASTLNNFGNLLLDRGEVDRAATLFDESIALRRALDDGVGLPISLHSRGEAALRQGDPDGAAACLTESLALRQRSGDQRGIVRCLEGLAAVALARGDARRAARLLGASAAMRAMMGVPMWPAERVFVEATHAGVRAALDVGTDDAWAVGHALTAEEAIAEAFEGEAEAHVPRERGM